jgi:hypothetical protein
MNHKKQRNIKFAVMFVVIAGLVGFLVSEELTGNPNLGFAKTFTLPAPDNFVDVGGSQIDVVCKLKQELTVIDSDGNTITVNQSSGIIGSPSFNIVNPSNINQEASVFVVIPKIACDAKGFGVVVEKSDLKLEVSARGLSQTSGGFAFTENIRYQSEIKFNKDFSNNDEKNLGWFSINDRDIESVISERDFTGNLVFDVTGNIVMYYDDPDLKKYKMTIPIESGDLVSSWKFTNVGENETVVDGDNDGIKDNADACPSSKETYNDYQDTDGCPDTVPASSTPIAPVVPVTKDTCNAKNQTWWSDSNVENGLCSTKYITEDGQFCKQYDMSDGVNSCIDPKKVSNDIPAKVKFQVKISMAGGGNQALQVYDDPSPFDVSIPLSLLGNGEITGQTGSFNVEPRLVISDDKTHGLTDTKVSNLNIETFVKVKGNEYSLGKDNVNGFLPKNGKSVSNSAIGFPLGSIDVSSFDIQNTIPTTIVPMGSTESVDLRFVVSGDIQIIVNDGTYKNIGLDLTGADFEINNLQIVRADASNPTPTPTPIPIPPPRSPTECAVDEHTEIKGTVASCVPNTPETQPEELSCKSNEKVVFVSGIPECALKTGDMEEQEQCPVGTDECIVTTGETKTTGGQGGININGGSDTSDSDYILYGAIGIAVLGFIAFALKRRN